MSMSAVAIYYWPWEFSSDLGTDLAAAAYVRTTTASLAAIGFACLLRPTNAILWLLPFWKQLREKGVIFGSEALFAM